jgi:aspartyl protease family protein
MLRTFLMILFAAALASQIPYILGLTEIADGSRPSDDISARGTSVAASADAAQVAAKPSGSGSVVLASDGRGHFVADFRLNGKSVEGLVDTGATSVAINESTARRLGFSAGSLDFRHRVNTANGVARAASVRLERVEIAGIRVRDVEAVVLEDKALSGTLIGMSFLKRLSSFQVQNGSLRLVQ